MPPTKLTEAFIRRLVYDGKPIVVRDTEVRGLMIAVHKHTKSYKVQRDLWVGEYGRRRKVKTVRRTLGTTDDLKLYEARIKATEVLNEIRRGIDPNATARASGAEAWSVEQMFEEYGNDLRARECADRTIDDMFKQVDRYLRHWKTLPIPEVTRTMAREKHRTISTRHGKAVANNTMRLFRAAYNLALRVVDDPDALPGNPVQAVTFNKVRSAGRVLLPDELPEWYAKVQALPNPLRRVMHTLGLFSGLRPGTLVSLRREWLHLDDQAISIPKMKRGEPFDLPLSEYMVALVRESLAIGDQAYPGTEWLFPTRNKDGKVIATAVWRERTLPSETGHRAPNTRHKSSTSLWADPIQCDS